MTATTFAELEADAIAHLNGFDQPRETIFDCYTCQRQHKGVIARRYGLDVIYKDTGGGVLARVQQDGGKIYCL